MARFESDLVGFWWPTTPAYWERLWTDGGFQKDIKCRFINLRKGPLSVAAIDARLTPWSRQLGPAMARDLAIWKNLDRPYADEVNALRGWTDTRLRWMDANLPGSCP